MSDWSSDVCSSDLFGLDLVGDLVRLDQGQHRALGEGFVLGHHPFGDGALAHFNAPFGHRSEEHTSELQSLMRISYAVFCLKKKTTYNNYKDVSAHKLTHNINTANATDIT